MDEHAKLVASSSPEYQANSETDSEGDEGDDRFGRLSNITVAQMLQTYGGYLDDAALCMLLCLPLANSGHY